MLVKCECECADNVNVIVHQRLCGLTDFDGHAINSIHTQKQLGYSRRWQLICDILTAWDRTKHWHSIWDCATFLYLVIYLVWPHQSWVKHLCGRWVNRTSVLEETHPMLFHSLQLPLETVHRISIYCILTQTVPSVDESFCEEMSSHIQICPVLSQLELMASELLVGWKIKHGFKWNSRQAFNNFENFNKIFPVTIQLTTVMFTIIKVLPWCRKCFYACLLVCLRTRLQMNVVKPLLAFWS